VCVPIAAAALGTMRVAAPAASEGMLAGLGVLAGAVAWAERSLWWCADGGASWC
jgi:hypothetical protein